MYKELNHSPPESACASTDLGVFLKMPLARKVAAPLPLDQTTTITNPDSHPTGIIGQWSKQWSDPLHILEWVFLSLQAKKAAPMLFELIAHLIIKCCQWCLQLTEADPAKIILPVRQEYFEWSFVNSTSLHSALQNFSGQIAYHLHSHKY